MRGHDDSTTARCPRPVAHGPDGPGAGVDARPGGLRRRRRGRGRQHCSQGGRGEGLGEEQALADAKADFEEKSAQFCDASQTYVVALDRYGDVVHETAVTVGDVTVAGSDLEQPQEDAMAGAEAAVEAKQSVTDAKQDLPRPRRLSPS